MCDCVRKYRNGVTFMSPMPSHLVDRWQERTEPEPYDGTIYWHVLLGNQPEDRAMARSAQSRLANFTGLHMTPLKWLHMTTLIAGSTNDIGPHHIDAMLSEASRLLAEVDPITVSFGRILYHPQAIVLGVEPKDALTPVLQAVQSATRSVTGNEGMTNEAGSWVPHITLCYSTSRQSAQPIIAALGNKVPVCDVDIHTVRLVVQRGPERLWDWHIAGAVQLGTRATASTGDTSYL